MSRNIEINTDQNAKMAVLTKQMAALSNSEGNTKPSPKMISDLKEYCHTHDITFNAMHNSATCTKLLPGHQPTATLTN